LDDSRYSELPEYCGILDMRADMVQWKPATMFGYAKRLTLDPIPHGLCLIDNLFTTSFSWDRRQRYVFRYLEMRIN